MNMTEIIEKLDIQPEKLYFFTNPEDGCWEIRERDAIPNKDIPEDALIAKFYYAPELAIALINSLKNVKTQN